MIFENKRKIIVGSVSFLFMVMMALFIGTSFEANDDAAIAFLISKGTDSGAIFQHKWLVRLISSLFKSAPSINWWTLFSVFIISVSFAIICIVIGKRIQDDLVCFFAIAVISCFVYDVFIVKMNFTKTAAMVIISANALFSDKIRSKQFKLLSFNVVLITLLYIVGTAIRKEVAFLGLVYLALIVVWDMIYSYRCENQQEAVEKAIKKAILVFAIVIGVLLSSKVSDSSRTDAEKTYQEFNTNRSMVQDYSESYPDPDLHASTYENFGYNANDVKAIFSWIDNDHENITVGTYKGLSLLKNKNTFNGLIGSVYNVIRDIIIDFRALLPLGAAMLVFAVICLSDPINSGIKLLLFFGVFFAMIVYFRWKGRLPNRVLESCVFLFAGGLLLSPIQFNYEKYICNTKVVKQYFLIPVIVLYHAFFALFSSNIGRAEKIAFSLLSLCCFAVVAFASNDWDIRIKAFWQKIGRFRKLSGLVGLATAYLFCLFIRGGAVSSVFEIENKEEILEFIDQREDEVFIVPVLSLGTSVQDCEGIWKMPESGYCDNLSYLGGWDSRSPMYTTMQQKHGIENPMRALIEDERVFSVDSNPDNTLIILTYLRDHFDAGATYTRARCVSDKWFIHYQKAIEPDLKEGMYHVDLRAISFDKDGFMDIQATTDYPGNLLYCNVVTGDGIKTYSIISEEGIIENGLAELKGIRKDGIESMTFFTNENGTYALVGEYSKQELLELL